MAGPHDKLIADAGKATLGPLGFRRKGKSRLWFADHSWWLAVVEFQPSAWSKGSYLNVGAHWLWSELGTISFDFGGRLSGYEEYATDEQFTRATVQLAKEAAREAERLATMFSSLGATADILLAEARTRPRQAPGHPGWMAYNAGIAAGLIGRSNEAREMFGLVLDSPLDPASLLHLATQRMLNLASDPVQLKHKVNSLIEHQRETLRLPPSNALPF